MSILESLFATCNQCNQFTEKKLQNTPVLQYEVDFKTVYCKSYKSKLHANQTAVYYFKVHRNHSTKLTFHKSHHAKRQNSFSYHRTTTGYYKIHKYI